MVSGFKFHIQVSPAEKVGFSLFCVTDPGPLPIVEPPPSPTPQYTATIDPTLAAQFVITIQPTRLPTFTEPAPIVIPTI